MTDTYVSAANAEVRVYGSFADVPSGVVGTDPTDPPDSTYIWPNSYLSLGTGIDEHQIGVAYFDPIDVRTNGSPRFRIRAAGTVAEGGYQAYPALQFYPLTDPFNTSAQIGSDVFPYGNTWGPTYPMGSIQEAEFYIPPTVQDALASTGVAVWVNVNGSTDGSGHIGMQVSEFRIALTVATVTTVPMLRQWPNPTGYRGGPRRQWPRPRTGGTGIR